MYIDLQDISNGNKNMLLEYVAKIDKQRILWLEF